jgi:hypothetical protein
MPRTYTLEPARERWVFEPTTFSELPGHRAVSAVDLVGDSLHGAFAHVVTHMEDGTTERAVTQRANLIVNAPELLDLADRLFNFYELHKSARGGGLGQKYQELRAKIMGEVRL